MTAAIGPLTENQLREAVQIANIPALLMVLYQCTGDRAWIEPPFAPTRGKGLGDHDSGGLPPGVRAEVRRAAVPVIRDLLAGREPALDMADPGRMVEAMSVYMGEEIGLEYGEMLAAEFARRVDRIWVGPESSEVQSPCEELADLRQTARVLVVGAGVGGIAVATQLTRLGVDFTLVEKAPTAGGVWWQNRYPGAGVDTPSHLYSLSFARYDWSMHFAMRDEIQSYLATEARRLVAHGADLRFGIEVVSAAFDEAAAVWRVRTRSAEGVQEAEYDIVLSSVGGLNRPQLPDVPGIDSFAGEMFHSAAWPRSADLARKRVVVVGTGASAMQIVPEIAPVVEHLTIVQRSPQWVAPFPKFRQEIASSLRALLEACSLYYAWYWMRLFWQFGDNVIAGLYKEPDWPHPERSVSARNDAHRAFFTRYIKQQLGDRLDLLDQVVPDYPPFGKRILLDNGWFTTLRRPNVSLACDTVTGVVPEGLETAGAGVISADALVWATGFDASRFVASVDVRNGRGVSLREFWDDDNPTAYLGVSVPGFPNFFMLGGPNSFPGSGSIMFWLELQARYVAELVATMLREGVATASVRADVHDQYNAMIDERHEHMVWTHPGMRTYYRNRRGRVVFVSPFRNVEFWSMLRDVDLSVYDTTTRVDVSLP